MEVEANLVYRAYLSWGWVKISSEFHLSDEEKYLGGQEELVFNLNLGGGGIQNRLRTDTEGGMDVWIQRKTKVWSGMVVHVCSPRTWKAEVGVQKRSHLAWAK